LSKQSQLGTQIAHEANM